VLLSIQGGSDLGLFEINEAAQLVANSAAPDANIIFGAVIDDALGDEVRVTVIAAGFDEPDAGRARPRTTSYGFSRSAGGSHSAAVTGASAAVGGRAGGGGADDGGSASTPSPGGWRPFRLGGSSAAGQARAAAAADADGTRAEAGSPAGADAADGPAAGDATRIDGVPAPRPGNGNGRPPEAASPRRKSVVFEEDDELDVPDFLK
jgi:cell division protein FtsZ